METMNNNKLQIPRKLGIPALHQRLAAPVVGANDSSVMPNRIALMLDASGSMHGEKIQMLRDAMSSFVTFCNMRDTALAIESFGDDNRSRLALTTFQPLLMTTAMQIDACGSTPLHLAMDYVLMTYSVTRGVIVSDGNADCPSLCLDCAGRYAEAGIPVDCVHIGDSTAGEDLLRQISERTNGKYIKFTDVSSFAKSFKYLTPTFYAQLTSGAVDAAQLGAKEIK
jgi:Mg-chelatase subunit ChlD